MYCIADGERRVLQLEDAEPSDSLDISPPPSFSPRSAPTPRPAPLKPRCKTQTTSTKPSSSHPPTESHAPDVVLHADRKSRSRDTGGRSSLQDSPEITQRRKRLRQDLGALADGEENQPPLGQCVVVQKSRRALFSEEDVLSSIALATLEDPQGALHVAVDGAGIAALVTVVEYIYRFKVRVLQEHDAMQAARLGQWLGMRSTMLYYCLVIAIRHVTTATWMEMLSIASTLDDKAMRRVLCDDLVVFVKALEPTQYYQVLTDMRCVYISQMKHHDILVRSVVGLINNVRLVEFWRNLLDALGKWLCYRFQTTHPPSLRAIHRHFAPEWKPYREVQRVEVRAKPEEGDLFTLLQFGKFQLQVRIAITDEMPIMWRIIRSSSQQLLSTDPDKLDGPAALDDDPQFWIRGQMKIKYWRAQPNREEVSEEVVIEYQHCYQQYSQWSNLVRPCPSSLAPADMTAAIQPEVMGKAQFRGKFFIWGDPVCSMYHFLLQTTLFYSAPHGASTELSDLMVVSEMQRLPLETLVLVLRSDRLRIPDGERTLLRCLNMLVFGKNFSYLGGSQQTPNDFNGLAKDVIRLYKCVRWCFVPLDDIIGTLRRSPRQLRFYELIEKGLQDTFRRFVRRRPWGWRKYRHAYMKNETNLVEFMIEAGENELSPEYFPPISKPDFSSQDSWVLSPQVASGDPPRVRSV
ncbi:hypothetical protein PF005_g26574 [Phytophthora fragariae]|uniref:Uncharacterized protein n=1 Tax=Phytophthora fragariae TaxID=53985 RepID=A0A6A3Q8W6_9STRA|nr:hypothetical protein PF007_g26676 [Phytophthora fragariae]KAE9172730.1 hypothetical protein PF005_g26574 [Phytophthora fragariae]KAE9177446.1 hypothetical protein PF004_g25771 [Phytophthora fragariae]KAE9181028.1 hypothetical protein PF002_g27392 [Phytophthora fragariae]